MKIAIVGTGYVGLVSAACFAELGHEVIGIDIDAAKVAKLKQGISPMYEPGLEELIVKNIKANRLSFTTDVKEALPTVQILFSAVATPPGEGFRADLKAVFTVVETVARHIDHDLIFVNKSTVPVGTGKLCEEKIAAILKERAADFHVPVVSNPEFLREGMAVSDTLMPDRIVVGINKEALDRYEHAVKMMQELYRPITRVGKPLVFMSRESAEIVKYASNAFLASKISFINMLSELAEKSGANIRDIAKGMGLDDRIGPRFLHAGIGYGGSCFPKDVQALLVTAKDFDVSMPLVEATDTINKRARSRFFEKILLSLPVKATVAVWGLSFKPKTDDMREAPSLDLLPQLIKAGHTVKAFDPVAIENTKKILKEPVIYTANPLEAAEKADALVILTEWDEFRGIDLQTVATAMKGKKVFDGRNVYDPQEVREEGLEYVGIGVM